MPRDIETPADAPDTFVEKVSAFGEFPETALREINQQDIDGFNPERDTPALNPFERDRVHDNTNSLLQFLEADQARGQEHANALSALRRLRTQLDQQAVYNTPGLEHAAKNPGVTAAILGAVGVFGLARWLTKKNEQEKRGLLIKTLAAVGIVGLAAWLLSRFSTPGLGSGLGQNGDKPKSAQETTRKMETLNKSPVAFITGRDVTTEHLWTSEAPRNASNVLVIGSKTIYYAPPDHEENQAQYDAYMEDLQKKIASELREYILAYRESHGPEYKPEDHPFTIIIRLNGILDVRDAVHGALRSMEKEFPECELVRSLRDY